MQILHAIAGTIALASAVASGKKVAPNVLVLLTDDQGWGDVDYNCYNDTEYCASMFTSLLFFPLGRCSAALQSTTSASGTYMHGALLSFGAQFTCRVECCVLASHSLHPAATS